MLTSENTGASLAEAEKRLLVWLAHRLPRRLNADHLTAVGAFGTMAAGAAFAAAAWDRRALWLVPLMLAVNWFGDSLDGTVARVRGHQRPRYGYYVDHAVDLVNATALFTGMAFSGLMDPRLGLALLLGYVLLCAESFLATHAVGVFRISFSGIGPTELRILLSIGAVAAIFRPIVTPFGFGAGGALRPERRHLAGGHGRRLRGLHLAQRPHTLSGRTAPSAGGAPPARDR